MGPGWGEAALHPGSRDLVLSYIYTTVEFRARFARAQFSYLHFEGLSLAGKWCAAALLWDPDSLSQFIHFSSELEV